MGSLVLSAQDTVPTAHKVGRTVRRFFLYYSFALRTLLVCGPHTCGCLRRPLLNWHACTACCTSDGPPPLDFLFFSVPPPKLEGGRRPESALKRYRVLQSLQAWRRTCSQAGVACCVVLSVLRMPFVRFNH